MSVLGVIVYYNPEGEIYQRLSSILTQVDKLILFNNGSDEHLQLLIQLVNEEGTQDKLVYFDAKENRGISAGLNFAREYAIKNSFTYLATFDQDSQIPDGFIDQLVNTFDCDENIAVVSPIYKDVNSGEESAFPVKKNQLVSRGKLSGNINIVDVFCTITSGSVFRVSTLEKVGAFRDDYFIDYVDNEYCLKLWRQNYRVCVVPWVYMEHALGEREKIKCVISVTPTNYSPIRKYYMTRNRFNMYSNYILCFPLFIMYDLAAFLMDFMRIFLFEKNRLPKMKAIFFGVKDSLCRVMGKTDRTFNG